MPARWTPDEDAVLTALWPHRSRNWAGWAELLPGRSPAGLISRANVLGLRKSTRFTEDDSAEVEEFFESMAERGHGPDACVSEYRKRSDAWTAREIEVLQEHYGRLRPSSPEWAELLPGRSRKAIGMKAFRIGLTDEVPKERWNGADDEVTRRYFDAMRKRGHTPGACVERYRRMNG
jgi:hypothetical protein